MRRRELVRFNGEVTITTTCVERTSRCIGRRYDFDPHVRARIVLADDPEAVGRRTRRVSRSVTLTCEQTRPNRNHHCPLTIEGDSFSVEKLRDLPCKPEECRLNMVLDATHRKARRGEVVVIGSDRPHGGVEGGKGRLSAVVSRGKVDAFRHRMTRELNSELPASFDGGKTVVYSQRLNNLQKGDVLLVRSEQRTAIQDLPYFISDQIIVSTRRRAINPRGLSRRAVSRAGLVTETTGFNCTLGPSAFQSPCVSIKAGMATIDTLPRSRHGRSAPLYVNLISRGFPKLAQERGSFPPARVLDGGSLTVRHLRAERRRKRHGNGNRPASRRAPR